MKLSQRIQPGVFCCALLSGFAPAAFAQGNASPLDSILAEIEASYDSAMWVVQAGRVDPLLALSIQQQRVKVAALTVHDTAGASDRDRRMERRWNTVRRLLMQNLDSLAARVTRVDSLPVAADDTLTPLVSDVTARFSRRLSPVLRIAAVSQLFDAFRLYRERLLALAEEGCLERDRLCLVVDPRHNRPYWGVTVSGYAGELYGIGGFMSISEFTGVHGRVVKGRRAVIGGQILANLWNRRELAGEISGGSVFGDFVVMPGVIISPRRDRAVELSGSVLYLPRSRLSLGVSYAVDHGLGVRAVYGFRPRSMQRAQKQPRSR
jgi:hypothetical protein